LQTINAVSAGKDVYVEKPLAATIVEGQRMVKAAEKFGRVVQVGLQRRSMDSYQRLREFIQDDGAGQITVSRAYRLNNMFPDGMGRRQPASPPAGLNWDRWLGPRQVQPYQDNIAPYKFRWWQNYSSQMGNWGVHYFDVIRWILDEAAPQSAVCIGGNYAIDDDRTIPDTAEAIFELPGGSLLVFGQYEASSTSMLDWGELELRGTMGTVHGSSSGFRVLPEKPGQFQKKGPRAEPHEVATTPADATADHVRDFLDCVKSRKQPRCPLIEGHRSTLFAHMANISLATGQRLTWDSEAEIFVNNKQANDLLHYEYRKGYVLPEFD
jgi:predicted dehydrogenase